MAILNPSQQWIVSAIFVLLTIIRSKLIFVKSKPRPIQLDIAFWNSDKESFIKFKHYQYGQAFWLTVFNQSFNVFLIGLFISLKEEITSIIGLYPWRVILLGTIYLVWRFALRMVPKAINQSINNMKFLYEGNKMGNVKIVVFVPLTHTDKVREAIGKVGGGSIGNYSCCSFSSIGIGRFKPNEKANPHIGKANKLEKVKEERIEFICPKSKAKLIIQEIKKVHPYEEVALDIYTLIDEKDI